MTTFIITAPAYTCLFWALLFLMGYRRNDASKRILFWFMVTASSLYLCHYCYFQRLERLLPISDSLYSFANLAVYPLYYLYIHKLSTNQQPRRWTIISLLPALIISLGTALSYGLEDAETRSAFINNYLYHESMFCDKCGIWLPAIHVAARIIFPAQVILYTMLALHDIRTFKRRIENYYSNTEHRSPQLQTALMGLMLAAAILSVILSLLSKSFFVDHNHVLLFISTIFTLLLFMIGYDGYRCNFTESVFQHDIDVTEEVTESKPVSNNEEEIITKEAAKALAERLLRVMETEQLYLMPDLKISDVTQKLQTNRNYMYYAINNHLQTSFVEIVNRMRIEHAQTLLKDNPHSNTIELMLQCGYTSESSFFRNFKRVTGQTPKQWLNKH